MNIGSDNGAHIGIGGDNAGKNITKTTTTYGESGVTTSQLWTELVRLRQECEADKGAIREEMKIKIEGLQKKIDNIQEQRIKEKEKQREDSMKRFWTGLAGFGVVVIGVIFVSLWQPSTGDEVYRLDALNPTQMYELSQKNEGQPPPINIPAIPLGEEEHCIIEAVHIDDLSGVNEPECYDSLDDALTALESKTGINKEELNLVIKNRDTGAMSAVIGVLYTLSGYAGSSTIVYAGSHAGCYGGNQWYLPTINQTVKSALKLGGCNQNTLYSDYYFNGARQWCNCSSVALVQVRSADYK